MKRSICCMVALMFVLPVLSLTVAAQTQQGDILGTVRDEQGSVMVGVQITIANETTGAVRNVSTDERGEYLALGFFSGFYRVEAALQGFQKAVVNGVKIEDQSRKRVDLVLKIGEITTEITVTDKASAIKTEGATVTTTMPRIFFEKNLTVDDAAGPGLQQAMWFPGSSATQGALWGGVTRRDRHVEWQVEGAQGDTLVAPRSRDQVTITMGSPSAEYGRAVTANITQKSGTNELHGEYVPNFINPGWDAVNVASGPRVRPAKIMQWRHDFNIGGPVYIPKVYDGRNKTFFFFDHYRTAGAILDQILNPTVPTQRMLGGDFSRYVAPNGSIIPIKDPVTGQPFPGNIIPADRLSSVATKVVKEVIVDNFGNPLKYVGSPDLQIRNAEYRCISDQAYWSTALKVDQNIGSKHVLSGTWNHHNRYFYKCGIGTPGWNRFSDLPTRRFNVGHTWVVTPRITNQLRVAFTRWRETQFTPASFDDRTPVLGGDVAKRWGLQGIPDNGLSGAPKMAITSGVDVFLNHNTQEQATIDDRNTISENLSYITGKHTIKGGYMNLWARLRRIDNRDEAFGLFTFDGRFTGVPFADFLLGVPATSARTQSRSNMDQRILNTAAYIQDDWRVTQKLNLSFGIRWDRYSAQYDASGLYFNFDPESGKMVVPDQAALGRISPLWPTSTLPVVVASSLGYPEKLLKPTQRWLPRFSLAYRPTGAADFVVRGGFGIYNSIFRFDGMQTAGPFALGELVINQLDPAPGGGFTPRFSFPNPFGATAGAARGVATGSSVNPNLRPEYVMTWNVTAEKALFANTVLRLTYMGNRSLQLVYGYDMNTPFVSKEPFSQSRRRYPAYQSITRVENGDSARYNTFQVQLSRPWQNGLHMEITYILQRGRATFLSYAWDRKRDYAISNDWPLQDFFTNFSYELPFGPDKRWLNNASGAKWLLARVVGGWSTSGVLTMHSGHRSTPTFGGYDSGNINQFSGRPDLVPGCDLYANRPKHYVNGQPWVNGACFTAPANGTLGNAPANLLEGPGQWVLNMSPYKTFRIPNWERARLTIGAAIYNTLNSSAYWTSPSGNIGNFSRQADGTLRLAPPANPFALGSSWVRRVGVEGNGQRRWWFQAMFQF